MNERRALEAAVRAAGLEAPIREVRPLGGGCIHRVCRVALDAGAAIVAKLNDEARLPLFEEEAAGLRALAATGTVRVPAPRAVGAFEGAAVLLLEALTPGPADDAAWRRFGGELAALHGHGGEQRYGFEMDNHIGSTPQINAWHDDWVEFNRQCRLGPQLERATRARLLGGEDRRRLAALVERLDVHLPRRPAPGLLHGDLWSGNALPIRDEDGATRIAVLDPACSFGDGWADIAMMRLFGGFPPACHEAYAAAVSGGEGVEVRLAVYQLYHLLNHLNLFGAGYLGQVMAAVSALEGAW